MKINNKDFQKELLWTVEQILKLINILTRPLDFLDIVCLLVWIVQTVLHILASTHKN